MSSLFVFSYYSSQPYHDDENFDDRSYDDRGYGYNYRSYRSPTNEPGIKGKIERKYWRSKQKVIEKLGKDQDEFVIAGDAEVDARLEVWFYFLFSNSLNILLDLIFGGLYNAEKFPTVFFYIF